MKPHDAGDDPFPSNAHLARLEAELTRFRPTAPSPQLLRRLDGVRAGPSGPARARRWRPVALTGLAAGLVAVAVVAWSVGRRGAGPAVAIRLAPSSTTHAVNDAPKFTLLSYDRALARSPEAFDALLAREAAVRPASARPPVPVFASSGPSAPFSEGDY